MTDPKRIELSDSIRSGSYFEESRKFYSEVYISIISERVYYLVLTGIATLTSLLALIALLNLLPIAPTVPFMWRSKDAAHTLPLMRPITAYPAEVADEALKRFFVHQYVIYRESYAKDKIAMRARVVYNWSTPDNYDIYRRTINTSNPRSPVIRYESSAEREIEVVSSEIIPDPSGEENTYIANVKFVAYVIRMGNVEPSTWSAEMKFKYEDVVVNQDKVNEKTGKMLVEPMKFSVSSYTVRERKEGTRP